MMATSVPPPEAPREPAAALNAGVILRKLGPLGPLTLVAMTLPAIGGFLLLYKTQELAPWLRGHGAMGAVCYAAGIAVASGLALLPTYAQSLLGGWAFGVAGGGAAALSGIVLGALIAYGIARRSAGTRAIDLIETQPAWRAVYDALLRSGRGRRLLIVTLLRLPPNSPFALTNLVLAATRVPASDYLLATAIGLAPRTIAMVYIGASLETFTTDPPGRKWFTAGGIGLAVLALAVIGQIARKAIPGLTARTNGPA